MRAAGLCAPAASGVASDTSQRGQQEAAAVQTATVGRLTPQADTMHGHPNSRISASAFSSQYVMPISRYIEPHALFGPHVR